MAIIYNAFVCLTTVGFGDISPMLPLSPMVSVATSVAGPVYLAAVMGVLSSRFASSLEYRLEDKAGQGKPSQGDSSQELSVTLEAA